MSRVVTDTLEYVQHLCGKLLTFLDVLGRLACLFADPSVTGLSSNAVFAIACVDVAAGQTALMHGE